MRIVNRKTFLALPANTLFSKYEPCYFGELQIKGETTEFNDFLTQDIADAIEGCPSRHGDILEDSADKGTSFSMDFECCGRDGCYYDDDQLFAVWEQADVEGLIIRLIQCLDDESEEE